MKDTIKGSALAITFCLVLSACIGRDFPIASIINIRPNVTTKSEIFAIHGEPAEKGLDTGFETWTYYHYTFPPGGKHFRVIFNPDGTVRSYAYSSK